MYKLQQKIQLVISQVIFITIAFFCFANISFADVYTSTNYKILEPVQTSGGGYSSSASFGLQSSIGQIGIGTSSATNFGLNAGFLYFPYVSTPIISTTAGNAQVSLSWTTANGILGWTASGYNLGYSTVSGGPYSSSALGNVLSGVQGGLTNGIPYYFVIKVLDAFGNIIATSTEVSATPVAPAVIPPSGGGGGGGGGGFFTTTVVFSGKAYPKSTVTLLKDAQVAASTVAGSDASFQINLSGISGGNYFFSVYSEDDNGNKSQPLTFPVSVTSGVMTYVNGIFLAPTIAVDKSEVKKGDNIAIFGQSVSQADIVISVHSNPEIFVQTVADKNGVYLLNFDTSQIDYGQHNTKSKASLNQQISDFSKTVSFNVSDKNVLATAPQKCPAKGDLNGDCKVNLVDFSIASYWYKNTLSDAFKKIEITELNGDGKVNLVDFSIMAYYWTG